MLIDSHCHFDFEVFDDQRAAIWRECKRQGIGAMVIPSVMPSIDGPFELARQLDGVYVAVGLHPWWVAEWAQRSQGVEDLQKAVKAHANRPHCVAIGECGLDGLIDEPLDQQIVMLKAQLAIAEQASLPVILHCRKAHNELISLLKTFSLKRGGVIHGFSGSIELARQYWDMGFYLGIGGVITYPRASKTRTTVANMPLESLLLETDAPDMPLYGKQGEPNSPLNLFAIAEAVAELKKLSSSLVADQTTKNCQKLFAI